MKNLAIMRVSTSGMCFGWFTKHSFQDGGSFEKIKDKEIFIFAASVEGKNLLALLNNFEINTKGFIDNNVDLQGKMVNDKLVYSIEDVDPNSTIIVSSSFYAKEIVNQLEDLGYGNFYLLRS